VRFASSENERFQPVVHLCMLAFAQCLPTPGCEIAHTREGFFFFCSSSNKAKKRKKYQTAAGLKKEKRKYATDATALGFCSFLEDSV
jgi:hypothetical protein